MRRLLAPALLVVGIAYPFGVYFSLGRVAMAWLALPLAGLWLLRACTVPRATHRGVLARGVSRLVPLVMVCFCLGLVVADLLTADAELGLRFYPVLVNGLLLCVFGASLRVGTPVITQIARLRHADLPPQAVRYTRHVTIVWCIFFAINGCIAAVLALWGSWAWWTLYNGAISYGLMGALLLGEWCVRPAQGKGA